MIRRERKFYSEEFRERVLKPYMFSKTKFIQTKKSTR